MTRLGVDVLRPDRRAGAAVARSTTFAQFNQEQTTELGDALNSDFNSLELELEKRMSNRWSGRVSYTYARLPRRRATSSSTATRGSTTDAATATTRTRSRRARTSIWATVSAPGSCSAPTRAIRSTRRPASISNGDGTNNDRPTEGVNDLDAADPSSALDSRGFAVRNGIDGERKTILDARFQYIRRIGRYQAGFFLEVYNLTNHANFGEPDRRAELRQLHEADRGGQPADGAAGIPIAVLIRSTCQFPTSISKVPTRCLGRWRLEVGS